MRTTNKIVIWRLNRVLRFLFCNSLVNLKFIKNKFLKGYSFLFQATILIFIYQIGKLLLGNAITTTTTFLGVDCLAAGLEIGGQKFKKI
jgi:hypothetical protein